METTTEEKSTPILDSYNRLGEFLKETEIQLDSFYSITLTRSINLQADYKSDLAKKIQECGAKSYYVDTNGFLQFELEYRDSIITITLT
jgi:hypothetical protein